MKKLTGTLIDGPITTQTVDSSGEIVSLQGLDITDFLSGRAFANFEHNNDSPEDIVGIFRYAKKIFSEKDCENERQLFFWRQLKTPFLYGILELFDAEGHPGAVAIAAMLRYFKSRNEPVKIGFSIEGRTLKREDNVLSRTIGQRCAITLRPCNKQCYFDLYPPELANDLIKKHEKSDVRTVYYNDFDVLCSVQKAFNKAYQEIITFKKMNKNNVLKNKKIKKAKFNPFKDKYLKYFQNLARLISK